MNIKSWIFPSFQACQDACDWIDVKQGLPSPDGITLHWIEPYKNFNANEWALFREDSNGNPDTVVETSLADYPGELVEGYVTDEWLPQSPFRRKPA